GIERWRQIADAAAMWLVRQPDSLRDSGVECIADVADALRLYRRCDAVLQPHPVGPQLGSPPLQWPLSDPGPVQEPDGTKDRPRGMARKMRKACRRSGKAYWTSEMKCIYRFDQKDRVLCCVGDRWLPGTVLSTCVDDPEDPGGERIPYVVKTDALPGFDGKTISAPCDHDGTICRERCWHEETEPELAKWSAPVLPPRLRKPLRFALGDAVAIRIWDHDDGREHWARGIVTAVWHPLPGPHDAEGLFASGEAVPYRVQVEGEGSYLCVRDEHTLIRRPENAPRTPGIGISKRFEKRKLKDGTVENFDHLTLRGRVVQDHGMDKLL
ncbi:unnamed protein product, partial [Prorocentrum cordatum]